MILDYHDQETERIYIEGTSRKFQSVVKAARRKLRMLDTAIFLKDLEVPPGNRLEKLSGDRAGQYSIRVNDQFRICFEWIERNPFPDGKASPGDAASVELTDYH